MPRKDKPIFVHSDVFKMLQEAKIHAQGLTGTNMTWSAFLYMLAAGALAMASLSGLSLKCPECGYESALFYRESSEAPPSASQSAP